MANDRAMDPYKSITINPSMQSMDDDLESIDHLSIDERTTDTR